MGQPANLVIALAPPPSAVVPAGVRFTLANAALTSNFVPTATPGVAFRAFPFSGGYQTWAGDCTDADPGGTGRTPLGSPPGAMATAAVPMGSVAVTATASGVPMNGAVILATHVPDAGCPAGETFSFPPSPPTGTFIAALPYGIWKMSVQGASSSRSVTLSSATPNQSVALTSP